MAIKPIKTLEVQKLLYIKLNVPVLIASYSIHVHALLQYL